MVSASRSSRSRICRLVEVLAFAARERRGVDLERHADRRLVDDERRQRLGLQRIAERVGDRRVLDAGERDDVAGTRLLDFDAIEPRKPSTCITRSWRTLPSRSTTATFMPRRTEPRLMRPMPIAPT